HQQLQHHPADQADQQGQGDAYGPGVGAEGVRQAGGQPLHPAGERIRRNGGGRRRGGGGRVHQADLSLASLSQVSTTVSGLSDTDSMPCRISHSARSGWSDGPWPQMPTYLPLARAVEMAMASSFLTAALRSSNSSATMPESRSRPRVSWVRSLEPIEKPSKISRNSSASRALEGSSHIMMIFRPCLPRSRPLRASSSITARPSSRVRTKGIMIQQFSRPISSRTLRTARHSSAKQSRNSGCT